MVIPPPKMHGANPAASPKVALFGGPTIMAGARVRWGSLQNPLQSLIPTQA